MLGSCSSFRYECFGTVLTCTACSDPPFDLCMCVNSTSIYVSLYNLPPGLVAYCMNQIDGSFYFPANLTSLIYDDYPTIIPPGLDALYPQPLLTTLYAAFSFVIECLIFAICIGYRETLTARVYHD